MRSRSAEPRRSRVARAPRLGPAARRFLARRPWIRRTAILTLAAAGGVMTWSMLQDVERARASWTDSRTVVVAAGDHEAGDVLRVRTIDIPLAVIPPDAVDASEVTDRTRATQRLADGEPIVRLDVARQGPTGLAPPDSVVVAVSDPLVPTAPLGAAVAVYAEGIVLADEGRVVDVTDVAILVAVAERDAPLVAAAAQMRTASLAFPA